uniref:Uncharacterized protein n=1 Tax=Seriola lalandi dorsalis TaxID=1841481 RepID=A0A3B4XCI2_SERLL
MSHPGGHSVAPYPVPPGGYGDPSQAPPPGFNMGYNPGQPPVMYQPGPVPEYGGPPGAISPAPVGAPSAVPVGVPPGLEYLTQVGQRNKKRDLQNYSCGTARHHHRLHQTGLASFRAAVLHPGSKQGNRDEAGRALLCLQLLWGRQL